MNIAALLDRLDSAVNVGGRALDGALGSLAGAASTAGELDQDKLERFQGEALRAAQLHAQLRAAKDALAQGRNDEQAGLLAAGFSGLTLEALRQGLPYLALHLESGAAEIAEFAGDPDHLSCIRDTTTPRFHRQVWEAVRDGREGWVDRLDETHRLLRQSFRSLAEQKIRPIAERLHREDQLISDELIAQVAELGAFGLAVPEAEGGFQEQPDHVGVVLVTEELSRGALAVGSLATRPEILIKALLRGGTEAQRKRWLPKVASGELLVAIAVTEPDVGSNVAQLQLSARAESGGYRLSGSKTWSTLAGRAELIALLARTEPDPALGHKGLSLFVVEKPRFYGHEFSHDCKGGTLTGRAISTLGYRGMHSFELTFQDYWVPAENLVGAAAGRGRGFYLQMEGFGAARLQTAGRALGLMQSAFEAARDYALSRQVFGKALAEYPLTQEKLARMACAISACRQAAYAAARQMDGGSGQVEASMIKFFACRQAEWITREAQQLHGGMGYAEEFPVSRYFVDARVLSIFEGTEEVLGLKVIIPALLKSQLDNRRAHSGGK